MISPEFELLKLSVRLADTDGSAARADEIIRRYNIDWDDLYERADLHCIKPQLARLAGRVSGDIIPETFRDRINDASHGNLFLQLRLLAEFLAVRKVLEDDGIPAVPFKGFWLAQEAYGNLADRESVDVDLFIDIKDLDRITRLMPGIGYSAETRATPELMKKLKKVSAEYNFDRIGENGQRFHFEFHWKIGSTSHRMEISLDDLRTQMTVGMIQNHDFSVFTPSAGFLLAMMHHGGKDPLVQLKHILDTAMMMSRADIDWSWVMSMAKRFFVEDLVYTATAMASELTGADIPAQLKEAGMSARIRKLAQNRLKVMSLPPERWYDNRFEFSSLLFHIRSRPGLRLKVSMVADWIKSGMMKLFVPDRLVSAYLKKRYRLSSKEE